MNKVLSSALSVSLVGLAVLAQLNLICVFVREWREGRRDQRLSSTRSGSKVCGELRKVSRQVRRRRGPLIAVGTLALAPSLARATEPEAPKVNPGSPIVDSSRPEDQATPDHTDNAKSPLSLQLNLDFTNAYFYHGIFQQDKGLIVQPAAKMTVNIFEKDDLKVDVLVGTWNSFGSNSGSQTSDLVQYWYESDLTAGVALTKGKVGLSATYTFLTSPSDAYETVQELDLTLTYDDGDLLGKFALHPYALLGVETGADASDGGNSNPGTYLELGIAPGLAFDVGWTPVSITFPASVGLSLHDYYENAAGHDDGFGFAQVGVKTSIPLPFGDRYGKWTFNAGVAGLFLGNNTAEFNGGRHEQFIGTVGIQVNY